MLEALKTLFTNDTVRRWLLASATAIVIACNKKFGLNLDAAEIAGVALVIATTILQSGIKSKARIEAEAKAAGNAAAGKVTTVEHAAEAFRDIHAAAARYELERPTP